MHVLADVLALDEDVVVDGLAELMQCSKADARRLLAVLRRRAVIVPVGAVLLLGVSTGLAGNDERPPPLAAAPTPANTTFVQPVDDPTVPVGTLPQGASSTLAGLRRRLRRHGGSPSHLWAPGNPDGGGGGASDSPDAQRRPGERRPGER